MKMAADEWRLCVDWLVRCKILPEDHRVTNAGAQVFDLAQALRDGVLLCHLLNNLYPLSVDLKDFSPRPQLSQFLCLKNIRTFLQTCKRVFGLKDADLFDPPDLFDVKNFRQVLTTLSKLSKTELAQKKYNGFPPDNKSSSHNNNSEEDIYGNLQDLALENDLDDNEELYDSVYQEDDDEIYEDLCSTRKRRKTSATTSELPQPVTKRDYCIKEMVDTERNYVDALSMLVMHFIKPLKTIITTHDRDKIFLHVENLHEVHSQFYKDLHRACTTGTGIQISEVFVSHKRKFIIYGEYCSNLPQAQEHIEEISKKSDSIKLAIEECERKANEGRFRLRDLLHVPMQRVLKYHLLLRELIKNTDKSSDDRKSLEVALDAMQDLSLYVNEVKRDNEALLLINEIQNSIVDLQMPPNTFLKDYGRLQKDGELKIRNHLDSRVRPRYLFLFDKVLLMGKSRGETYSFKEAIVLAEYKVDDSSTSKDRERKPDKWNCSFQLVKRDNKMAYTFFAKTEEMKRKWIDALRQAQDNSQPAAGPNYVMHTFSEPKECDCCGKLLRGVIFQGYLNPETKKAVHKECIGKQPPEKVPSVPPRSLARNKAVVEYKGIPAPGGGRNPLLFAKDAVIDILNNSDKDWWKGRLRNEEGWFPAHLVTEHDSRLERKASYVPVHPQANKTRSSGSVNGGSNVKTVKPNVGSIQENMPDVNKHDWYVGPMSRDDAVKKLNGFPNGSFLIRVSENLARKGEYSLSIKYSNAVRHIRVEKNKEGYYLADTRFFHSVPDLVEFYQKNSLADSFPEVDTTLQFPVNAADVKGMPSRLPAPSNSVRSPSNPPTLKSPTNSKFNANKVLCYAVAVFDYAATSTTQLSLARGDKVAVISKTGSDKGWWKGEHCTSGKIGYFPLAYVREEEEE
ncbi:hypothetical protein CHS0354_009234 [Potamilus streckersoni]|uniref:Guanine nucleotide exchange factor VAV2 n=1 Tax=Potamilus streckersoni TaxID=2493646 RepID=A0AAE0SIX1_9BIVA|nr:hypothetical protein CHS0354_009234 [Potamilus streckersoni]